LELARQQREMIQAGGMSAQQAAHSRVIEAEVVEVKEMNNVQSA
jgi:hypothetical protein